MEEHAVRINKYLADAGICSRREADRMIEGGRVRIDGVRAVLGDVVAPGSTVLVDGAQLAALLMEYDLGVSTEAVYAVKRVDTDFFAEG